MNVLKRISVLLNSDAPPALFLDRDGVINRRIEGNYVKSPKDFEFIEGVPEAIAALSQYFSPILVVTNQQGIGKGLMSENDLEAVHQYMKQIIEEHGGHIDRVYHCPALESSGDPCRKPKIGMALEAKKEFRHLRFRYSIMVGDSLSDMVFGSRLGMLNVFLGTIENARKHPHLIHLRFPYLIDFAKFIDKLPQ